MSKIVISSFTRLLGQDLNSKIKNLGFLTFHCVPLALASQKERRQRLIIFSKFLLFSIHLSCWMQDAKSRGNVWALKDMF